MSVLTKDHRLTGAELEAALGEVPAWTLSADRTAIARRFLFSDFQEAFRFMTELAALAESANHHPEWCNV